MPTVGADDFVWETAALPLAKGVDLRTPGRAVDQQRLLRFENGRFMRANAGIERRRGHVAHVVRGADNLPGVSEFSFRSSGGALEVVSGGGGVVPPESGYLFGHGIDTDGQFGVESRDAGFLAGCFRRDEEAVFWDGFQFHRWTEGLAPGQGWGAPVPAVVPSGHTSPIAERSQAQKVVDLAVGTSIGVVAWAIHDETFGDKLQVVAFDPVTGTEFQEFTLAVDNVKHVRCIAFGEWAHVVYSSFTLLGMKSVNRSDPWVLRDGLTTLGECNTHFDLKKLSDDLWIVAKRDATDNRIKVTYLNADGSTNTTYCYANTEFYTPGPVRTLAVAVHPLSREVGLVWLDQDFPRKVRTAIYDPSGANIGGSRTIITSHNTILNLTIEASYLLTGTEGTFWVAYAESGINTFVPLVGTYYNRRSFGQSSVVRRWLTLTHHAFRVGNLVYFGVRTAYPDKRIDNHTTPTKLQHQYLFVDAESLLPVARFERGTAATHVAPGLASVHPDQGQSVRNRTRFHAALGYLVRLPAQVTDFAEDVSNRDSFSSVFSEESIKRLRLDFLPRLRSAQMGRAAYVAGAQVGAYDGRVFAEAGFHTYPENVTAVQEGVGDVNGTYRYKVRWAWKNAQGEEQVSASVFSPEVMVANSRVTVKIPAMVFTQKPHGEVYVLVYRNQNNGTAWHLVSSRDPSHEGAWNGYLVANGNDDGSGYLTFVDNAKDADIVNEELDRFGLEPFSPPAAEVIAGGRDRIWLAGGELPPGDILPSLLYEPGQGVAFNQFLQISVDRGFEPITGFGFLGHTTAVFKRTKVYAFESDGPDNQALGGWDFPRVMISEVGALSQESIAMTKAGLMFQSAAGFRMLAPNYLVHDVGQAVLKAAKHAEIFGAVVFPDEEQVRYYRPNGSCLVYDWEQGEWAVWTGLQAAGAVPHPVTGLAMLARTNGEVWVETDGVWSDAGTGYAFTFRTAWLHAGSGLQEFLRLRRFSLLGDFAGAHTLRVRVFYNDRDFPEDEFTWNPAVDLNAGEWGGGNWGDGLWGDNTASHGPVKDRVYAVRRRPRRQKCSRFSIEVTDLGPGTEGPKFTEIALELGRKAGLTRQGTRTLG